MAKKKPVVVTITEGKHKTQPWTFSVDKPGPGPSGTVKERYTRQHSCKLGAVRWLGGYVQRRFNFDHETFKTIGYFMQDGREIRFVVKPKTTKS